MCCAPFAPSPQPAGILPSCINHTPPSNYSAPHNSVHPPVDTFVPSTKSPEIVQFLTSPITQGKLQRAEANRLQALEILHQTFPSACTVKAAQPCPMLTASKTNHCALVLFLRCLVFIDLVMVWLLWFLL